jgi:hypothetical protein
MTFTSDRYPSASLTVALEPSFSSTRMQTQ